VSVTPASLVGEPTVQQLYPLGAMAGRTITLAAAIAAPLDVMLMSVLALDEINTPVYCLIGFALVAAASLTVVIESSPLRAPFTGRSAMFAYVWANLAYIFGSAATFGTNEHLRDDYGPVVVGIIILSLAPYRPARELAVVGLLSAILVGSVSLLQAPYIVTPASPFVFALAAMTPLLLLSLGAATFTDVVVKGLERWRRQARIAMGARGEDDKNWIARSVQQDRVTILNRDVVPFFAELLHDKPMTTDDIERARIISDSIRSVMVAEVDRSWLESVIETTTAFHGTGPVAAGAIADERRLAQRMSTDQRSAMRAFLVALFGHPSFTTTDFSVTVSENAARFTVELTARLDCPENQVKSEFAPYFAVMRILFADLEVEVEQPSLALKFSYEQ